MEGNVKVYRAGGWVDDHDGKNKQIREERLREKGGGEGGTDGGSVDGR